MSSQGYNGLPAYYSQSSDPLTPNVGFSLKGMDPIVAENFVLADAAIGTGGGSSVKVNGSVITNPNFNGTTPAAPGGSTNVTFQVDGSGNISAQLLLAATIAPVSHQWLASYSATTGLFTQTQPAASDLSNGVTGAGAVVLASAISGFGSGTVTSVSSGNIGSIATVSVATATITPAISFALATQSANTVWAGPTTGAASAPTFRALVAADVPVGAAITIATAGAASPSPAYTPAEAPTSINPAIYVQDINGSWHQQAGIDTTTAPNNYPNSGPTGPLGTLLWTRRQYHRDNLSATQTDRNTFSGFNHAFGVGTSQENQDSTMGLWQQNGTMTISGGTVSSGVVQFNVGQSGWIVPGQIYTPAGLSTLTALNNVPLQVVSLPSNILVQLKAAPFTLHIANNASAGNTQYAGYINRGTNTLAGQTVVIAGFTNAANNGTFTVVSNVATSITVNNPSGVSESPAVSIIPTATVVIANVGQTSDTGTLDQYFYGIEGMQSELDVYGTPTFTSAVDGEVSTLSVQLNALNPSNVSVPNFGYNGIRVTSTKSGAGQLNGNAFAVSGINAAVHINNTANNGAGTFPAIIAEVTDVVGGAPSTIGTAVMIFYPQANRCALRNYGLFTQDYSKCYSVTSVANASGGQTVYNGTFAMTGGLAGQQFKITGFVNAANNGTFTCNSNTSSTLTLANAAGVAETKTVQIQALNDWSIYSSGGQVYIGGNISTYNNVNTVRNGIAAEYALLDLTSQNAAKTATTLLSAPQTGAYKVSWSAAITTASDGSSVLGGSNGFQVLYTSPTDSVVKTTVAGNSVTSSANTTGTAVGGVEVIYAKAGTNIQFTYDYTSVQTTTAMVYELHVTLEAL